MIKFPGTNHDRKIQIIVGVLVVVLACIGINKLWGQNDGVKLLNSPNAANLPETKQVAGMLQHGMGVDKQEASPATASSNGSGEVVVFITGAVQKPGIVKLKSGARLYEAIQKVGLREDSAQDYLNLAEVVKDGQKYFVPNKVQAAQWKQKEQQDMNNFKNLMENSDPGSMSGDGKMNINMARAKELEELNGIGPALAQAIVTYRKEKGNFKNIDELKNVPGIGDKKFDQIKSQLRV